MFFQVKSAIGVAISACLLAACGGSSDSGNSNFESVFSYVVDKDGRLASIDLTDGRSEVVINQTDQFLFAPTVINTLNAADPVALISISEGRFVTVSQKDNVPKIVSSLTDITNDSFCQVRDQKNGETLRVFYSTAGIDQDCNDKDDNNVFYIDSSMNDADEPIAVSNNALFTGDNVEEVYSNGAVVGYLITETNNGAVELVYYNNLLTESVRVQTNSGFNPATDEIKLWNFYNSKRSILRLGRDYFDLDTSDLALGHTGLRFLTADGTPDIKTTSNRAYISLGSDYYRHDADTGVINEFSTLHLPNQVYFTLLEQSSVIATDDSVNPLTREFFQVDESGDNVEYRIIPDADYDRSGAQNTGFRLSSTGTAALATIELDFNSAADIEYALYIKAARDVTRIDNAKWLNPTSENATNSDIKLPIYSQVNNGQLTIAQVNEADGAAPIVYGELPVGIEQVRIDRMPVNEYLLVSTIANDAALDGLVYRLKVGESGSLEQVANLSGFSVIF